MTTALQPDLFATAAARLFPWGEWLRRLPLFRARPLRTASGRATAPPSIMDPATCGRSAVAPARINRTEPSRFATSSAAPRQARALLRVVRIVEAEQTSASSGRIIMCGRMADVCAELDRMVEREKAP
jgi:hypothetical protein